MYMTMATSYRRNHSRRRLAALTFLSNISLDGTHRDTKLGLLPRNKRVIEDNTRSTLDQEGNECTSDHENLKEEEPITISYDVKIKKVNKPSPGEGKSPEQSNSSDSNPSEVPTPSKVWEQEHMNFLSKSSTPFRERTSTAGSDYAIERRFGSLNQKRKMAHQSSLCDEKHHHFSSNESLGSNFGNRMRVSSSTIPEVAQSVPNKEVRIIRPHKHQLIHEDRLILVSVKHIPFLLFSHVRYNRDLRSARSDLRREGGRRRHASGTRPLSAITDGVDPFDLLGVEKGQEGQEISYGQLLVPSRQFARERKFHLENDATELLHGHPIVNRHHIVARCFSYDGNVYRNPNHIVPGSPPIPYSDNKVFDWDDGIHSPHLQYSPNLLDDPELIAGKHRTLLTFTAYMKTENVFRLNRKDLLACEFAVLVALEFGLHVPTVEVFPHYQRLVYES